MDQFGALQSAVNDPLLVGNLRTPGNEQGVGTAALKEEVQAESTAVDTAQFSGESLELARAAAANESQAVTVGITESENNTEQNNLADTGTNQFGISTEATGRSNTLQVGVVDIGSGGGIAVPEAQPIDSDVLAGENETLTAIESAGAVEAPGENIIAGAAGTVIPQKEPSINVIQPNDLQEPNGLQVPAEVEQNPNTAQAQADRLGNPTDQISAANNQAAGNAANTTNVERVQTAAEYQQNVLLQNVGSQLAQTIAPAAIFSVIG